MLSRTRDGGAPWGSHHKTKPCLRLCAPQGVCGRVPPPLPLLLALCLSQTCKTKNLKAETTQRTRSWKFCDKGLLSRAQNELLELNKRTNNPRTKGFADGPQTQETQISPPPPAESGAGRDGGGGGCQGQLGCPHQVTPRAAPDAASLLQGVHPRATEGPVQGGACCSEQKGGADPPSGAARDSWIITA